MTLSIAIPTAISAGERSIAHRAACLLPGEQSNRYIVRHRGAAQPPWGRSPRAPGRAAKTGLAGLVAVDPIRTWPNCTVSLDLPR